jgi:hypothetical protein
MSDCDWRLPFQASKKIKTTRRSHKTILKCKKGDRRNLQPFNT